MSQIIARVKHFRDFDPKLYFFFPNALLYLFWTVVIGRELIVNIWNIFHIKSDKIHLFFIILLETHTYTQYCEEDTSACSSAKEEFLIYSWKEEGWEGSLQTAKTP